MTDEYRVTLDACIAGNPFKAWNVRLPADAARNDDPLAPDREPPDDVWEQQSHTFTDLDAAKAFIRGLPTETTTHVVLEHLTDDGAQVLFVQDAGADHLDDAAPGVTPPHLVDAGGVPDDDVAVPEAPELLPAQGANG